jgi:hypothetical protein
MVMTPPNPISGEPPASLRRTCLGAGFAAVRHRDYWFRADHGDWQTKRAFTALVFFFTLAQTGSPEKLPLITIPAQ